MRAALSRLPERTKVLFTAHSLPERVLADDPYAGELAESAAAIAGEVPLARADPAGRWRGSRRVARPSRGAVPTWPTSSATWAPAGRPTGCWCAPRGSCPTTSRCSTTSTSTPRRVAGEAGLDFARTASINDEPAVMAELADLVRAAAHDAGA